MSLNRDVDQTPAYCQCGEFGAPDSPKRLIQVRMHLRHCKMPGAPQPAMILADDGTWVQMVKAKRLVTQTAPAHRAPKEKPTPPLQPPEPPVVEESAEWSWPAPPPIPTAANGNGHATPPGGKLVVPSIPPGAGELPPPPMTGISIRVTQSTLQLYDYARQRGYIAAIDDFVDQAVRGYFRYVHKKTVAVIDLE